MRSAEKGVPILKLAGGFEFAPFVPAGQEKPVGPAALARAFEALGYDLGQLTAVEAELFARAGLRPPRNWLPAETPARRALALPGGNRVGVLLLPELKGPLVAGEEGQAVARLAKAVAKAVRAAKKDTKLVVAVSPWGAAFEQAYLEAGGVLPDILLGAGPGPALAGRIAADGRVLWLRATAKGKAVNRVTVLEWPKRAGGFAWVEGKNVVWGLEGLTEQIADDAAVAKLLEEEPTETSNKPAAQGGYNEAPRRVYRVGDPFQERSR